MDLLPWRLGLCWLICFFPTVESIVFELNDLDLNRVIFEFQSNLKMTCNASELVNPVIVIRHDGMDVTDLGDSYIVVEPQNAIELTISQVTSAHNGLYECMVTGRSVMMVRPLTINAIPPRSVCLQSEVTLSKAEGEQFTLYCYFQWFSPNGNISPYNYTWHVRNGSEITQLTGPSDIVSGSVKGVIITTIGPLDVSDSGSTYICDHPLPVGQVPCEIGPINVSVPMTTLPQSDPTTTQPQSQHAGTGKPTYLPGGRETSPHGRSSSLHGKITTPLGTIPDQPPPPRTTDSDNASGDTLPIIVISAGAGIAIIIFIAILLCLVFCCVRRSKKETNEMTGRLDYELTANPIYGPGDEEGGGGGDSKSRPISSALQDDPRGGQTTSFEASPQKEASAQPTPAVRRYGRESVENALPYDAVNHGVPEQPSREAPKMSVKRGSHNYDDSFDGGESLGGRRRYVNASGNGNQANGSHKYDRPPGSGGAAESTAGKGDAYEDVKSGSTRAGRVAGSDGAVGNEGPSLDFRELYGVVRKESKARAAAGEDAGLY